MLRLSAFTMAATVTVLLLAGCGSDEATEATISVENVQLRQERGAQSVTGVVRNDGDEERSVQLEVALYNARNQRIGEVQVPVERIPAGGAKGFDWSLEDRAEGARVLRIIGF